MSSKIQLTLDFKDSVEDALKKKYPDIIDFRILSKALDARGANKGKKPRFNYSIEIIHKGETFEKEKESYPDLGALNKVPIIVGAGPAGLFCALRLAEYGIPSLILERGERAHKRMIHIAKHWRYGQFDEDNNVCYGEGGAGLFSDGKLITRIKSPYVQYVMDKFVEFGAPKDTAYLTNPHLGSNKIRGLINKITNYLKSKNCEIRYNCAVDKLISSEDGKKIIGVKLRDGQDLESDHVILATGHSAKEIYNHLKDLNFDMKAKDFAVGVRIEHPRSEIDKIQYGDFALNGELGAARYRLSYESPETHKGSYSFCMCPGGYVLSSGTDADGIVVNGMSNFARNSPWSNSALVVSVKAGEDFSTEDVLGGLHFQNKIEKDAYNVSKSLASGKEVPSQRVKDFVDDKISIDLPKTSCPSGLVSTDLGGILPKFVSSHLRAALQVFQSRMDGFVGSNAVLMAPETRTSAPVTILRDRETFVSTSHSGLYPCGEGAGYAGGITSAAVDGIKVAMSIIKTEKNFPD